MYLGDRAMAGLSGCKLASAPKAIRVKKVAVVLVFVHPLSMSFHHCCIFIHLSSRGWTMGPASATVSH